MLSVKRTLSSKRYSNTTMSEFKRLLQHVLVSNQRSKKRGQKRSSVSRREALSQSCLIITGRTLVVHQGVTKSIFRISLGAEHYVKVFKHPQVTRWWRQIRRKLKPGLLRGLQVRPIWYERSPKEEIFTPSSQRMYMERRSRKRIR